MTDFFPTEDYKIPETSNYMKLTEGEHTFRVVSSAITGFEYFNKENKPIRSREPFEEVPNDIKKDGRINHFWAFIIWNYDAKRLQIMEITQKTIMTPLKALIDNPKWGSPKNYDITITRKGTTINDTEYAVMPNPHTELSDDIKTLYIGSNIKLQNLYDGADPFSDK